MARKSDGGVATEAPSKMAYFRAIYLDNRKLLRARSNRKVIERWLADNPGHDEMPDDVKNTMANVKSILRKKLRMGKRRKKAQAAANDAAAPATLSAKPRTSRLETLEVHIDDCLSLAKTIDREALGEIIKILRRARNEVVWKMG